MAQSAQKTYYHFQFLLARIHKMAPLFLIVLYPALDGFFLAIVRSIANNIHLQQILTTTTTSTDTIFRNKLYIWLLWFFVVVAFILKIGTS